MATRGLVFTNDNCTGCNKCIRACRVLGANIATYENGKNVVEVDPEKCISCGACINACEHDAREYYDDTEAFFSDLKNGEKITLLLAPAFKANYKGNYKKILGSLKKLGVKDIVSVSFGADITTWAYINYITKYGFLGGVSQPCPAVVNYIEKYRPEVLNKLVPVHSPLMCAATYLRKYKGLKEKFAFISPCIAKKDEIDDSNTKGLVHYNVTYDHLMTYLKEHNLMTNQEAEEEAGYGLGSIYPMPGGLKENAYWFLGENTKIRQVEGPDTIYPFLNKNKDTIGTSKLPYLFIDALNCKEGCLYGTGVEHSKHGDEKVICNLLEIKDESTNNGDKTWFSKLTPKQRLAKLNAQFKDLTLEDFTRKYNDISEEEIVISDAKINESFMSMNKQNKESREINCGCCGYETCKEMATAIQLGYNSKDNCVFYQKELSEYEKKLAEELSQKVEDEKEAIKTRNGQIVEAAQAVDEKFENLHIAITELKKGNEENSKESVEIASEMKVVHESYEEIHEASRKISEIVKELVSSNEEVKNIAEETNLLSLNAQIEAARVGEHGRGFAVVATNINGLAESSKETADRSSAGYDKIQEAVANVIRVEEELARIIETVGNRTENLAASTEEITASAESVEGISSDITDILDELANATK
jgi:iron only hydrogenase large subunit-like protein